MNRHVRRASTVSIRWKARCGDLVVNLRWRLELYGTLMMWSHSRPQGVSVIRRAVERLMLNACYTHREMSTTSADSSAQRTSILAKRSPASARTRYRADFAYPGLVCGRPLSYNGSIIDAFVGVTLS